MAVAETGPQRLDHDESSAELDNSLLENRKVWVPCVPLPCPLDDFSARVRFRQVSCGAFHTVAISETWEVYACGLASRGRLGLTVDQAKQTMKAELMDDEDTPMINVYELVKVPIPPDQHGQHQQIASAHCGRDFTLLRTKQGQLLSAGAGTHGIHCNLSERDDSPIGQDMYQRTTSHRDTGEGFGGSSRTGNLALTRRNTSFASSRSRAYDRYQFSVIPQLNFGGQLVTFVSAGEDHASVINMNGELWCWGSNAQGQCGMPRSNNIYDENGNNFFCPMQPFAENMIDQKVTIVASGGRHTLALTSDNRVFGFGCNKYGQLGLALDEFESFDDPRELYYFREKIVSWLAAGSNHSVALTIEGYAYVWGRNNLGQLGQCGELNARTDQKIACPRVAETLLGVGIAQASCNYAQTFLGCAEKIKNKPDSEVFTVWKNRLKKHEER